MYFEPKVQLWKLFSCHRAEKKTFRTNHWRFFNPYKFVILCVFNHISVYPYLQNKLPSRHRQSTTVVCCLGDAMGDYLGLVDEDGDISARRRAMGRVELVAAVAGLKLNRGGLWGRRAEKERRYCTGCDT